MEDSTATVAADCCCDARRAAQRRRPTGRNRQVSSLACAFCLCGGARLGFRSSALAAPPAQRHELHRSSRLRQRPLAAAASRVVPAAMGRTEPPALAPRVLAAALAAAATSGGALGSLRRRRWGGRGRAGERPVQRVARSTLAAALTGTAPMMPSAVPMAAPQSVDPVAVFDLIEQRTGLAGRVLATLPPQLPMALLSTYTLLPLFAALTATLCPTPTLLARSLAGALGCLLGTTAGTVLDRAKKDAARQTVLRLLTEHMHTKLPLSEFRSLIQATRRRFGVGAGRPSAEAFEDTALGSIYEELLSAQLEGPEHDATDLPALRRLKAALDLDGIVVGVAHKQAAQSLVAKGERLEGEAMRRATDKLLFLSQRAFSDEEPEEAEIFEMNRLRKALRIPDRESKQRINAVSRALYQQNLSAIADKVDGHTGDALAGASAAFGLPSDEAALMNAETYRQIAADQLKTGVLSAEGKTTLEQARGVLQLGDRAATVAFVAVAAPILRRDVDEVSERLREGGAGPESVKEAVDTLTTRYQELGLAHTAMMAVATEGFTATLRSFYDRACKDARINGDEAGLATMDKMTAFASTAGNILAALSKSEAGGEEAAAEAPLLTLTADTAAARRLYGLYLERSFGGEAQEASPPDEFARLLELSEADEEAARVEVCQPRLRKLYVDAIERSQAQPAALPLAKAALGAEMAKFQLPQDAIEETAMEVYKSRLDPLASRVIKANEKIALDNARSFLGLSEADVRVLHLKAFAKVYEESVQQAMGRAGVMTPEAREALEQLRERLGLNESDAEKIFHGAVEVRMKEMMVGVREAWETATYTKEALTQLWKERGKDIGDDPSADGSGAELGIKDTPTMEGVRGFELMIELTKIVDFYLGNQVVVQMKDMPPEYPVTVGKQMDDKTKEEIYGIFAWNAITCQDSASRDTWTRAKPHVGGILGLSEKAQEKVLVRMVSRWANMFIKQKIGEQGKLSEEDISTLTNWVPMFFGIDKDVTKDMVQGANKGLLVSKALRLLNQPAVTPDDVQRLREEVDSWDLRLEKDLELTRPQLRAFFRVEVTAGLEDPDLTNDQKQDLLAGSREAFGLGDEEAGEELADLMQARCRGCLVNAVGDLMQGNQAQAVKEMQRFELLASFASASEGLELRADWDVAPAMKEKLIRLYESSPLGSGDRAPDVRLLETTLGLVPAKSG